LSDTLTVMKGAGTLADNSRQAGRPVLQPGPGHPISVTPTGSRVLVKAGDEVVADSANALTLQESNYPAAQYVPLADVNPALLSPSSTTSYCPYKGDCSYYSLATAGGEVTDAVWTYREPYPAVASIAGHVAFYPNKVTITVG
jgi:uncharacterized protein (DUF427 family)